MMHKLVYRVECKDSGRGPYQSARNHLSLWSTRQHGEGTTPTPGNDEKLIEYGETKGWFDGAYIGDLFFAFESMNSLYDWFTEGELSKLMSYGFIVKQYEIPEHFIIQGSCQVVFTKDRVVSSSVLETMPQREKIHPQENYVYEERKYTEEESEGLLALLDF